MRLTAVRLKLDGERVPAMGSGLYPHAKDLEQVHLCLGMAAISQTHPQRYAGYVLNTLPRRRHEFALVPGDSREARQSLLGVFLCLVLQGRRLFRRLCRHELGMRPKRSSI